MPLVRISLVKGQPEAYRRKVGDAIHRALVETIGVPPLDRFQLLTEHEPGDIVYDSDYLGIARSSDLRDRADHAERRPHARAEARALPAHRRKPARSGRPAPQDAWINAGGRDERQARCGRYSRATRAFLIDPDGNNVEAVCLEIECGEVFKEGLLKGKRILITGGGTGLGKEIAAKYLELGARSGSAAGAAACWRKPPKKSLGGNSQNPRGRHPRRRGGRRDGAADLGRERPAHRPGQQRRRQLHQPDQGPLAERLQRHRQHRVPRHVLRHARGGQALDRGRPQGLGDLDPRHLGAYRLALRRALGDVEGRPARDDQVARGRMGPATASA